MKYKTLARAVLAISLAALGYGYLRPGVSAVENDAEVVVREGTAMSLVAVGRLKRDADGQFIILPGEGATRCPT